ncbi:YDG domain-containing protein [Sphingomonas sp. NSE70-1]|uniref:YDG domain-containing protein n=1 Tax=Sphingomonas caseinilyticus TaxID=2908205 RepID=A0ABT0RX71_9SPHN|nr:YDG domain-containing protein [Sphingomonas caseinilyticus]MCL6699501.1 YDG domain-containing protein [Sphingomonas caseinilyticus]
MATIRNQSRIAAKFLLNAAPLALALGLATPANAQFANTNAGTISTNVNGGSGSTVVTGATANGAGADTTTITLGNSRTILNWDSFNLSAEDSLNYVFNSNTDIVLNRVNGGTGTQINGALSSYLGAVGGTYGGNVWFIDPTGIAVGGNATVNVGGLLLSTLGLTDADFFDDNSFNFSGVGGAITVNADAGAVGQLNARNGAITMVAPGINFSGNADASTNIGLIGARNAQILFDSNLGTYLAVTINQGSDQVTAVNVTSSASFNADSAASGGKTLIMSAGSGGAALGSILLGGTSADRVEFVEGDVVLHAAGDVTVPTTLVSGGAVQPLGAATGQGDVTIGALNVSAGNLDVRAADDLTTNQTVAVAQGSARLEAGDLMTVNTSVSTKGDYTIVADDWTGTGVFAPTFTGGAGVGDFNITDTAFGLTIGGKTAPDDLRITTVGGDLTINGAIAATNGNIELGSNSGNIILNAPVTTGTGAGRYVMFTGSPTQNAAGVITTNTLQGSGVQFTLDGASNQITNLGPISTFRDIRIKDAGGGLAITGNLSVTDGWILLTTPGVLSAGAVSLTAGTQKIMEFTASSIALTGTSITGQSYFHAPVIIGGNVTMDSRINGTSRFEGTISGDGLAGADSLSVRNIEIVGAVNNSLANLTTTGTAYVSNNVSVSNNLTIGGQTRVVSSPAGSIALTAGGNLVLTGSAIIGGGSPVNLSLTGGAITASTIGSAGTTFTNVGFNGTATISGDVLATGAVTFASPLRLTAGNHLVQGSSLNFGSSVLAVSIADDVTLRAFTTGSGAATFSGSIQDIDQLAVDAGQVTFAGINNRVGTLAVSADTGAVDFNNNSALTIGTVGTVNGITASGPVSLQSSGGMSLQSSIVTPGNVSLYIRSGDISQAALAGITANQLSIFGGSWESTIASAILTGNNDVNSLDGTIYGSLTLANSGQLTVNALQVAQNLDVSTTGNMTVAGDVRNTHVGNLSLRAGGDMTLNANLSATHAYTAAGNVNLTAGGLMSGGTGKTIIGTDISMTADDWTGGILGTAVLKESRDLSIIDTSGLTISALTDVNAVRNLSITTLNGDLNVGGIAPGGSVTLSSGGALTITDTVAAPGDLSATAAGSIAVNRLAQAGGNAFLRSTGGSLSIGSLGQVRGVDVTLAAAGNFSNAGGAGAIAATNRWLVYSTNPASNSFGGLDSGNTAIWNASYGSHNPASISGNRYIFTYQPIATVTTVDASKVYGTDLSGSTASLYTLAGLHAGVAGAFLGDTLASAFSGAPLISSAGLAANADVAGGPYAVTATGGTLVSTSGYGLAFANSGKISVTPKALTGTVSANDKTYDGTTSATGSVSLSGVLSGDDVTASALLAFADRNAGSDKSVTISGGSLSGSDAGNYSLSLPASTLASIFQKALTGTVTANDKTYDGTAAATGSVSLSGVVGGDNVTASALLAFADKNAGSNKVVTISGGSLSGTDAGNYSLTLPASTLASILQKALTGTVTANNKTYDGTIDATGSVALGGVVAGDNVTAAADFAFADKNAGTGKTVNVSNASLAGSDAGNYTLSLAPSVVADIFQKSIAATVIANDKTYDGTNAGSGTVSLAGIVAGDSVSTSGGAFTFTDKNAGTDKSVTVSGVTLTGTDADNYALTVPASVLADIFQKAISATVTADDKIYDGTVDATGSVTLGGVISGDTVGTSAGTFSFADKNAGPDKLVTVSGVILTGTDASNYSLSVPGSVLADIMQKVLTATVTANSRTYDGTTSATGSVALAGIIGGDMVGASDGSFEFTDKNAGTGKAVTVSGIALTGSDAGNYSVTIPATVLADIFRKTITATVVADDKTYDGTTAATGSVNLAGTVSGDSVTGSADLAFADKNAGTGKVVTVSNAALAGVDAGNYLLETPSSALADIARKAIGGTVTVDSKTYDGTTAATGSVSLQGVVAGDTVAASANLAFADKNAGTGKTVNVTNVAASGADAGNYVVTLPGAVVADILKKAITGSVTANSKTYDGTTDATGTIQLTGVIAGDSVTGSASLAFSDKNAGTGKIVNVGSASLSGSDAGNYSVNLPASVVADILKRAITVSADAQSKIEGSGDPALTYAVTQGSLVTGDTLGGGLTRAPGEGPGDYAIGQGSLAATANYELTFVGNTLTIEAKSVPTNPVMQDAQRNLLTYLAEVNEKRADPLVVVDERNLDCSESADRGQGCDRGAGVTAP